MGDINNIITPPIMGAGGGIRRTYEDSIIRAFTSEDISFNLMRCRYNPQFYEDVVTGCIYLFNGDNVGTVSIRSSVETVGYVSIPIDEVRNSDRFRKLTILGIAPLNEKYCLVELIDSKILKEHLLEEKSMRLERHS